MDTAKNKSVLVTGGRGFVGRALVKLLRREGYRVISVDCAADPGSATDSAREIVCDTTDANALDRVFRSETFGGIVHLAAILPTAAQREPLLATQVNIDGSLNLLELARRFGVRRFVFGSSLSIYGTYTADHVVSETDRAAPEDVYGAAKLYVERVGESCCGDLEFVSLRIGRVVGPGARSATSAWRSQIFDMLRADSAAEIVVPYCGTERVLLVHVDDVARMLVALLQASSPAHGVYNAVCESVVASELKREVECLNPKLRVRLGEGVALGNPRLLDSARFRSEFDLTTVPIFEQIRKAAGMGC